MGQWVIDINCDVGEGVGNEASLFPYISSCNIACGGHAGDVDTIRRIVKLAKQHHIKVGAHPSYPDRANFGRQVMDISPQELQDSIKDQLKTFMKVLQEEQVSLHHIKAHGALYNQTAKDEALAEIYLDALVPYVTETLLYVPFGSEISKKVQQRGFDVWYEAFADRNYNNDLSLVSRKLPNALIQNPGKVLQHVVSIITEGKVLAVTGEKIGIEAQTLCIHGDTASALEILMYLSEELPNHQVRVQ
ncbi:MAG: 5-oxoprolinase subunit PxpA [Flavobacteriaceae bacterium]|uniref:5-oxoprolinase subunit PxpA n=1 Tax=Flagellimonas sp. SN16 TaxID=3415142 RepID=UPI003C534628|nr:5-oxoprolinase subunit PxpA [Flavobacteriaceae bacterium]